MEKRLIFDGGGEWGDSKMEEVNQVGHERKQTTRKIFWQGTGDVNVWLRGKRKKKRGKKVKGRGGGQKKYGSFDNLE